MRWPLLQFTENKLHFLCGGIACNISLSLPPHPVIHHVTTGEEKYIHDLIEQLASTNSPPQTGIHYPGFITGFPPDYDHEAQDKVDHAIEELSKLGKKAFPLLVAHSYDKRYSCTRSYAIAWNHSVGDVCFMILEGQVENFRPFYKMWSPPGLGDIHFAGKLAEWWRERETWTLRDLQLEAIDRCIEGEMEDAQSGRRAGVLKRLRRRRARILNGTAPQLEYPRI